jgi:hypothetical protein
VGYLEDGSIEQTPAAMEKFIYTSYHDGGQLIDIDTITGITVTDIACFGITGGRLIKMYLLQEHGMAIMTGWIIQMTALSRIAFLLPMMIT